MDTPETPKITPEKAAEMFGASPEEQADYAARREQMREDRKNFKLSPVVSKDPQAMSIVHLELTQQECRCLDRALSCFISETIGVYSRETIKEFRDLRRKITGIQVDEYDEMEYD